MPPEKSTPGNDAEAAYGGADAVAKTSYVTGSGTEPEERLHGASVTARTSPGGGANPLAWIAIALLVLVGATYLLGFLG